MEDSRSFYILVFALFMTFVVSAAACIGISTSESNENRDLIDSLGREILILKQTVETKHLDSRDSIIVEVNVRPQTIKIYNKCTN